MIYEKYTFLYKSYAKLLLFEYKKKNYDINSTLWKIKHRLGGMS